jgi:hypothetical protein
MQVVSNINIVFNYPKTDCSQLYLLATPPIPEPFLLVTALLIACSTHASAIGTLHSASSTVASSRRQYPASCDGGGYYHLNSWTKIISKVALESGRLSC